MALYVLIPILDSSTIYIVGPQSWESLVAMLKQQPYLYVRKKVKSYFSEHLILFPQIYLINPIRIEK